MPDGYIDSICISICRSAIVSSVLELGILGVLREGPLHGYELKKRLVSLLGPWTTVSFGSLYPALARLERAGYIRSDRNYSVAMPASTGSLKADLAAFTRQPTTTSGSPRNKKVLQITDLGTARLIELLTQPAVDERAFELAVAFCDALSEEQRIALFSARVHQLQDQLRVLSSLHDDQKYQYRRSLGAFRRDRLRRDITWVETMLHELTDPERSANNQGGSELWAVSD